MTSTPVSTIFDAAKWFLNAGEEKGEYIPPLKLNCLLYLAQGYYAALTGGGKLMPAHFVAHDIGPIDPNLYRAMEQKSFSVFYEKITGEPQMVFKAVWRKYAVFSADELAKEVKEHAPYKNARAEKIKNNEIPLRDMARYYAGSTKKKQEEVKPKVARNQDGANVAVKKWLPKRKGA